MKRILLALTLTIGGLTHAVAAEQVLVVDDAHLQAPGAQPATYTFSPSDTLVVDATNYQFKVPRHFTNMPINSLQLALAPDQLYAAAWTPSTPRLVLSEKNLSPIPGSKLFSGLKSGQEGSIALGNFDAGKFSVVWAGRFIVR